MSAPARRNTPQRGFRLLVEGAQLADLIQISCQNGTSGTFEVRTPGAEGRLHFDQGRLVHAECDAEVGLSAVVRLLEWPWGEAVAIDAPPPEQRTIDMSADTLLLHAAQRMDDASRRRRARGEPTTGVVRRMSSETVQRHRDATAPTPGVPPLADASDPVTTRPPPLPSMSGKRANTLRVARLSHGGDFRQCEGGADEALADRVLIAARTGAALARALGLGHCRALHARGDTRGLIVCVGNSITGVEGRAEPLAPLAKKLEVE